MPLISPTPNLLPQESRGHRSLLPRPQTRDLSDYGGEARLHLPPDHHRPAGDRVPLLRHRLRRHRGLAGASQRVGVLRDRGHGGRHLRDRGLWGPRERPKSFMPDIEDLANPVHEIKRKGGDLRYCQKCSHYKPPRAHHCRVCKRCVLRMDHHCVWINNCVGHANYKVFLVFMLYAVIACIHSMVLLGVVLLMVHRDQQQNGGSLRTPYIISGVLLIPLTLALSVLLGWHMYLILHNKTTIEYHEGVRAMWLAEKVGNIYRHPYDLGVYENLVSVLGPNIFCWICPIGRNNGSGLGFRTSYDGTFPTTPR